MKIVIAGGTGFLGDALGRALADAHHDVVVLTRSARSHANVARRRFVPWQPDGTTAAWGAEIDGAGAVVNLAGESIAGRRWTHEHKRRVRDSRANATRSLVAAMAAASSPPAVFVSGSAVGYYGPHADEVLTEQSPAGADFLARVCVEWEAQADRAASSKTRVALIRTGLVLERDGGALPQMLPPFRLGVGGPVGSGKQFWPWIHRADWIALVQWIIQTPVSGPINATAPSPVTNAEFARTLGRVLHRPAFMPAPGFALRLLLGEMADALLLSGQRAVPAKAESLGFRFRYTKVEEALRAIFNQ